MQQTAVVTALQVEEEVTPGVEAAEGKNQSRRRRLRFPKKSTALWIFGTTYQFRENATSKFRLGKKARLALEQKANATAAGTAAAAAAAVLPKLVNRTKAQTISLGTLHDSAAAAAVLPGRTKQPTVGPGDGGVDETHGYQHAVRCESSGWPYKRPRPATARCRDRRRSRP